MNEHERYVVQNLVRAADEYLKVSASMDARTIAYVAANIQRAKMMLGEIKVPYWEFCHTPEKCQGRSNCPRDPVCCD